MTRANTLKIFTVVCLFLALSAGHVSGAFPEERPAAFAMVIDVPIRVLGIGLALVGTAFFIVALPFALTSGSTGDAWSTLVVEPFQFTFTRPLGKFDEWRSPAEDSDSSE
ncbi:MAG: hypothetical protein H8E38_00745 [SAR324 cluster bacterium]|nr:hypothetical protein [SAR324 cluster bacterium]MBL7035960.1 hypothetical protein [SAR324 cluster bacterium]